jgi:hypothetical protein
MKHAPWGVFVFFHFKTKSFYSSQMGLWHLPLYNFHPHLQRSSSGDWLSAKMPSRFR